MRIRTSVLATLAAVAAAAGITIPVLASTSSATPAHTPSPTAADIRGSGQSVIDWNRQLITILGTPGAQPPTVHPTRSLALLQTAEYDAVASITHESPAYRSVPASPDARPDAAADQAAHDVLTSLYPSMQTGLDARLAGELDGIAPGRPKDDGLRAGAAAASQLLALRAGDGSAAIAPPFVAGTRTGDYRPTPPKFPAPVFTTWGSVTPFVLAEGRQFRPAAPPPVSSAAYTAALKEVDEVGRDTSTTRTADQTTAATFWSSAPVWNTWNEVTQQLLGERNASLAQATAVFAALDLSLADTTIALYDAKYQWRVWRPVTAIQVGDPTWNPLTPTAPDPSYPGAHSAISEAAATVLASFYGSHQAVTITSSADPGVIRSFGRLSQAADEAGLSRIWAGQHTRIDHRAGQELGRRVGTFVLLHAGAQQKRDG